MQEVHKAPSARPKTLPFIPKPFPPPALKDIPESYIVAQLRSLGSNYWNKPESGDCTLISLIDELAFTRSSPPEPDPLKTGPFADQPHTAGVSLGFGVRVKTKRLVLRLHQHYLVAQSTFFRALLGGLSPFDDLGDHRASIIETSLSSSCSSSQESTNSSSWKSHLSAGAFPVHPSRRPRILPSSSAHHPVIYVPVPDSSCLPHLIHYLYFGSFLYMEECLHRGIITWDGLVRNVEYLGLDVELKAFLGRYYRQWLKPMDSLSNTGNESEDNDLEESDGEGSCISLESFGKRQLRLSASTETPSLAC